MLLSAHTQLAGAAPFDGFAFNIVPLPDPVEPPDGIIDDGGAGAPQPFGPGLGDQPSSEDSDAAPPSSPRDNAVPAPPPSLPAPPESAGSADSAGAARRPATRAELGRMSREELFRLAFGRSAAARPRDVIMVLVAEGRPLGNTEVVYSADFASFRFISPEFARYLDTLLLPERRSEAGDSVGYFSSSALKSAGYTIGADELSHELHIILPSDGKALQRTNLKGGYAWEPRGEPISPAFFSFVLNYSLSESFLYARTRYGYEGGLFALEGGQDFSRYPAELFTDWALNARGWVLEGTASFWEPSGGRALSWENYRRGDVRLVREIVPWQGRLTAIDVGLDAGGGSVGGVRYEYNRSFFGGSARDEESSVAFFLPKSGWVEVFINGVFRGRFRLPAGRHEVTGFGGETGRNDARLVLRMDDGSVEEVPFDYYAGHPRNLAGGESRYSLAAGFRRETAPSPA
jgi:hypothetical protein